MTEQPVRVTARVLWQPKEGHSAEEYEDAAAVSDRVRLPVRAAVADGATEAAFSRIWAQQLVRGFVDDGALERDRFLEQLMGWQQAWQATVAEQAAQLAWYAAAKQEEGAYAAFLGLAVQPEGAWRALAVGDCCLFHLRDGALVQSWPLATPEAFHNRPALLPSRLQKEVPVPAVQQGGWQPGDAFVLATDAIAAWLMEKDPSILRALDPVTFQERVEAARTKGTLRNDDVTLLLLEMA